jgi:hypothetical protein
VSCPPGRAPAIRQYDRAIAAQAWRDVLPGRYGICMSAQPIRDAGPADPAGILELLPASWHAEFLAEYRAALEDAQEVRHWPQLAALLRRWQLRAIAYSDPDFEAAMQEARDARPEDLIPVHGRADRG